MYERVKDRLLTRGEFAVRVAWHGTLVLLAVAVTLGIGVIGYHSAGHLSWIDALLNASMILGGMGPVDLLTTRAGKLFASFYALFSGLFFIAATGVLLAPFFHRVMHRFHLERKGTDE